MAQITAALVKELRDRTGAGMMECKKALTEANGDIELAIENMRKSGQAKAAKKAGRTAAEGVALVRVSADKKFGVIVELNCETDFVAKDEGFLAFANKVADYALETKADIDALKAHFEEDRANLVAKIGENITVRRLATIEGTYVGGYTHGAKIAVLDAVSVENEEVVKQLGMHIAASRPEYLSEEEIPADVIANEQRVQLEIANEDPSFAKKPAHIQEQMLTGRLQKFKDAICLLAQPFVMNPDEKVAKFVESKGLVVEKFIRVEVGEGIEKKEEDFAAEVAKVTGSFN